jgi:putative transposase
VLLEREGMKMNHKKLYRLYREERLAVKRRRGRKRAIGSRQPMPTAPHPNARWSRASIPRAASSAADSHPQGP